MKTHQTGLLDLLCEHTQIPAYVVTSFKGSPALSSHLFGSLRLKYSAHEPVLRGHLSYAASFCPSLG